MDTVTEEGIEIAGRGRRLEGILAYPQNRDPDFGVLLVGPHPFLGGDLQNNLVRHLLTGVAAQGALALAFNYAGVGASEGGPSDWPAAMSTFWSDGRIDDERDWLQDACSAHIALAQLIRSPVVVIGYSFGCWVASHLITKPGVSACVLVSPNPNRHAFDSLNSSTVPIFIVCSDNDFSCGVEDVVGFCDQLREPKSLTMIHAGEHFFRGQEGAVLSAVMTFLRQAQVILQDST